MKLSSARKLRIQSLLLAWFRERQRDLPWRRTRDAYRIWLSEIMLQQTRVAAVVPYYEKFLARFPTVESLASAPTEEVLRLWAGLGYYRRARHLRRAAREIVARHEGEFPRDLDAALALPGVGRYTAAAVLSIAYGKPLAVLDGNVARVLARFNATRGDLRAPARWKKLQDEAQALLAPRAPSDWNQAMMELGATVCTPRSPRCSECPLSKCCAARRLGLVEKIPARRAKRTPVKLQVAAAVLQDPRGRTFLVQGSRSPWNGHDGAPLADLFSRMWQFPAICVRRNARAELARFLRERFESIRVPLSALHPLPLARHTVTFRALTLLPFLLKVEKLPQSPSASRPPLAHLGRLPVSNATRKIATSAQSH
ncbi:MAG TPA: A/G-specific adenine glycosylase [Candidatus Acidoferrales bacterium]|nr:A/G-specific adenine glycosylase [Candidatus Acidoferrales bacterium]